MRHIEELTILLEAVSEVRPELKARMREGRDSSARDVMERLINLYTLIGANAGTYIAALRGLRGNVRKLPSADRRRKARVNKRAA